MKLSEFFPITLVKSDGVFTQLDEVDSMVLGSLAYCQSGNYLEKAVKNANITCLITKEISQELLDSGRGIVVSNNPKASFYELYNKLVLINGANIRQKGYIGNNCNIHPTAIISEYADIGDNVTIGTHSVINPDVVIGKDSYIDGGVVIGAQGLQFYEAGGRKIKVMLAGKTVIGEGVTILSNSVIVRAIFQKPTSIGDHTQIGILSNIGHDVVIGRNCFIGGNCLLAGKVCIGDNVDVGASTSIAQGIKIGKNSKIMIGSVVVTDVAPEAQVSGNFAITHRKNVERMLGGH